MSDLEEMLGLQLLLQRAYYDGRQPANFTPDERSAYIQMNILAATDELHEALQELSWKPWSKAEYFNRDLFVREVVDTWHFLMNLLLAADCSPGEFMDLYREKNARNIDRWATGYTGLDKCPNCNRELDAPGAERYTSRLDNVYCSEGCAALVEGNSR